MPTRYSALAAGLLATLPLLLFSSPGPAQESPQWQSQDEPRYPRREEPYRPRYETPRADIPRYDPPRVEDQRFGTQEPGPPRYNAPRPPADDAYRPPRYGQGYETPRGNEAYSPAQRQPGEYAQRPESYNQPDAGRPYAAQPPQPYGRPYTPPGQGYEDDPPPRDYYGRSPGPRYDEGPPPDRSFSSREILDAGHGFFGSVSKGLASVVEYAFQKQGRPNGYILGQDAGGAFIAGLRYGEGILYTKDAGSHRIYWQGPSIGWDAGAEGSKVMVLVYNLRGPEEIYQRFGGVDGSAYLVGGVGLTFLQNDPVIVAPIRAGVGLRFGANVGYLKYTSRPTWNPF